MVIGRYAQNHSSEGWRLRSSAPVSRPSRYPEQAAVRAAAADGAQFGLALITGKFNPQFYVFVFRTDTSVASWPTRTTIWRDPTITLNVNYRQDSIGRAFSGWVFPPYADSLTRAKNSTYKGADGSIQFLNRP